MTNFRIVVTSDTVCPWCYVGRRQLQQAQALWLQKHPDGGDTFSVTYAPFQLNPAWPRGPGSSVDKQQFYQQKFGPARTEMIHKRLSAVGQQLGIDFKYGGRTGNTRDSHRLVQLAKGMGPEAELKVIDGLFAAYFEEEKDITAYETLQEVAAQAGIAESTFKKAIMESDEGGAQVDEAVLQARESGITGVPDFRIQDAFSLNGANDPAAFLQVFEEIKAVEAK
ncbi:hypothetical protein HIM_03579 [Hirsutella minnesotensis 3608]|uniref:DSBA-like thioredoxin domain-containing protein n=1 Tax=Hirsutella minnesotensis 3608 TaxID=1043627 RepID=A0A0F7ZVV2_9HYPO|nr:hypothetical protein HIM_03579 [Hirsutella minnesotensis 3608]